jgi:multisubunit Na+/H+ antiporter MnhB subunit
MAWLVVAALCLFFYWCIRHAKEKAAEMSASGELRSPLYWIGATLAMAVLALSMAMATMKPTINPVWWLLAVALFVAALVVRRALRWRYPH